jgi:1,4-alpha-glucan branching enzyme
MPAKPSHQARLLAAAKTLFSQVVYPFKRQVAQPGALPSALPGMGAVLHPAGASFRVWAPNADQVYVCGSFNGWSREANPLAPEGNGYWSADVAGVTAGASYKYRIVNQIGETAFDVLRVDPYARLVTSSIGDSVVHDTTFVWDDDDYRTPPWNEMVIYEMHIGTFTAPAPGQAGTFDGACEKLTYLQELGVNVIKVMPLAEFPGDLSWGYNPAHLFAVETNYGGPEAFKRFVKAAHESGIAVVLDVVYNHFGPSDLDLWQFDGWSEEGYGGIYFYNDWRANTPWGHTRPDYGRPEVRQFIRDNALYWLEEFHLDGLRFDATAYIRNVTGGENEGDNLSDGWNLLRWINDEINERQPWKITIAEDLRTNPLVTAATAEGGAGFDAQWDAGFVHPVRAAIIGQDDAYRSMEAVAKAVTGRYNDSAFKRIIYTESHDEVANGKARVPEEIWPANAGSVAAKKRSTLGAVLTFTAPGIPMIFQGQEFLEDGWFEDNRPLDWGKVERYAGIHLLYRTLFKLRRNWENQTAGLSGQHVQVFHVNEDAKIIAYQRWKEGGPGDTTVVIANFGAAPVETYAFGLPAEGVWRLRFNSDAHLFDPEFSNFPAGDVMAGPDKRDGLPASAALGLGPYSALIYSQERG